MGLYHVWFSTKRRKWLLEGDVADLAERAMLDAARADGIRLLELGVMIDHVHVLVDLESSNALPHTMKMLKGKSAHRVFQEIPELKLDAGISNLWQRG
jgi:putative transposase